MTSRIRRCAIAVLAAVPVLAMPAVAKAAPPVTEVVVHSGETWVVPHTLRLHRLVIEDGGTVAAPVGDTITLTRNGVETGSRLTATGATDTELAPGTYSGKLVLTVAVANDVAWQGLTFPFRQALYVDGSGVEESKSVLAGVVGGRVSDAYAADVRIRSTGEAYNGVYVKDGSYTLIDPRIRLAGNGRSDFVGYGAALVGTGTHARLVVDGAQINNTGAARPAVVADGGSNVIVKNSQIAVHNGTLPADYQPTVDLAYMESVPWMLSLSGNNRATNLVGVDTKASYINDKVSSEGWGVLSTDSGQDGQLTAIDSQISNTGQDGYGSYAIGNATERFLGTRFGVATYATINRGGAVYYGDSTKPAVAALNTSLGLGLSARELAQLPVRPTVINSRRFGVMWHGAGSVDVSGGTQITSKETTFLDKGQAVAITVDGSGGARLKPGNGVLMQVMEDDDPGPVMVNGKLLNIGVYHEPTGPATRVPTFDTSAAHTDDAAATFTGIVLRGDFYNAIRGAAPAGPFGPGMDGKNLVLTFDSSQLTGVITSSASHHAIDTITAAEYRQLGEVTNTPQPAVNNGVIVDLAGTSRWTVTGTSYLTKLTVGAQASVAGAHRRAVHMSVDGVDTPIIGGHTYTGNIVVTVG